MSSYRDPVTDFDMNEAPWPRPGDDPFAIASNSRLVASLNFTHDEPWGGYAEGFKRLADIGVAHIEEQIHGSGSTCVDYDSAAGLDLL